MRLYVERPVVAVRQIVVDLVVVLWVCAWVRVAFWLHGLLEMLAVPGQQLEKFGGSLADNLAEASSKVDGVPLVGGDLAGPLADAAGSARSVAGAGQHQQDWVHELAVTIPIVLLIVPLGLVFFVWLPLRVRGIRRRSTMVALRKSVAGRDLLALRALARQPLGTLSRLHPDIAQAWRQGDGSAVDALVALELRGAGLKAS